MPMIEWEAFDQACSFLFSPTENDTKHMALCLRGVRVITVRLGHQQRLPAIHYLGI